MNRPVWSLVPLGTLLDGGSDIVSLTNGKYLTPRKATYFYFPNRDNDDRKKYAVTRSKFYKKFFTPRFFGVDHLPVSAKKFNRPKDEDGNETNV